MRAEHPLRAAARQLCPQIRRDRGDGLYIARDALPEHEFFLQRRREGFTVLLPTEAGMAALRGWLGSEAAPGFSAFEGRPVSEDDTALLCEGIKLLETACAPAQAAQYEKALRQRAAVLLRKRKTDEGGALPLCMLIVQAIVPNKKGE